MEILHRWLKIWLVIVFSSITFQALGQSAAPTTQAENAATAPTTTTPSTPADTPATPAKPAANQPVQPATVPAVKAGNRHQEFLEIANKGDIDLLFVGDSITDFWRRSDRGLDVWEKNFAPLKAANFGINGDRTQHVLWRVQNGELEGFKAKCIVLMLGTNNLSGPGQNGQRNTNEETIAGLKMVVDEIRNRQPQAKLLLLGIFPRGRAADDPYRQALKIVNTELAKWDDGKHVFFLDIGDKFLNADGTLAMELMNDPVHPNTKGYQVWADAILPKVNELLAVSDVPSNTVASGAAATVGLGSATVFPPADAKDICPDTPLRITFANAPVVGSGKIQVCDAANDAVVQTVDVSDKVLPKTIGGVPNFKYYPILISGNEAAIYLPNGALAYNKTYYVKVDSGAFKEASNNAFAVLNDDKAWHFTTKAAPPAAGAKKLTVAADGSGDFATVQGAIDFIPDGNNEPVTIFIRKGTYNEILVLTGKNKVTFLGEDRKQTIIAYANNNTFNNNAGGNPFAPGSNPSTNRFRGGSVYRRGMFLAHRVDDLTVANLTLHNTTPHGGSQSEAIILNGSPNAHAVLANVDLYSFQDTLQINGQAYITNCHIEGDVDFMWGRGPCFFENCELKSLRSNAYYTQIRNPATNHGYIYKNCTFNGAPDITGNFLTRIDPSVYPNSEVVLLDCVLTSAVGDVAWRLDRSKDAPNVHFWEYNSHDADGKPVDTSKRLDVSKQLKLPEDKETIDNYSDAKWVLGGEWTPKMPEEVTAYIKQK